MLVQQVQRYLDSLQVSPRGYYTSSLCDAVCPYHDEAQRFDGYMQDTGVQRQNADFYQLWRVKHDKEAAAK